MSNVYEVDVIEIVRKKFLITTRDPSRISRLALDIDVDVQDDEKVVLLDKDVTDVRVVSSREVDPSSYD